MAPAEPSRTEPSRTEPSRWQHPRAWMQLAVLVIALVFLYFYQPFEDYLVARIPGIRADNLVFWFTSLVGVVGYVFAHWQSFRQHIVRSSGRIDAERLVFDTLQVAILVAVIFSAGATLQAVVMLGEHLVGRGTIIGAEFGSRLMSIILLVLLAIGFFLLHFLVRAIRSGWTPRRAPPRSVAPYLADRQGR